MGQTPLFKRLASFIILGAFPTLFPYSKTNFNIPRSRIVTLAAYAKHILKYQDGRFSRYLLFYYYVFNRIIREQALNTTRFLYSRLDKNSLSLDKLNNLINSSRGNQGIEKPFIVKIDYKNLIGFIITKELNYRQIKQAEMLIEYYFKIQYTKGTKNTRVGALSRKAKLQNNKKLLGVILRKDSNRLIRYNYTKIIAT